MAERHLENLGAAIRKTREARDLSRRELGEKIHATEKTVERYENGTSGGAMVSLANIAEALDVSTDDLLVLAAEIGNEHVQETDLIAALNGASRESALGEAVAELSRQVVALKTELSAELGKVQTALAAQQKLLERAARSQGAKGS